ncbi:hypothetical protein V2647_06855 [Tenacibaculum maritimum]|uniref:hypothetical protein n=1 Tax=Tenacibaculum maritimum TaxID=107401 RepID=UPI0012E6157D|nr:hypothetical protein [Tenacibaculum maritimum]CAA0214656.1 conserved hypothetical protein [Tenacibaculum maritimum]CAA0250833.1 conserved hypothetical protein [Tenacibaculum maritimum]
MNNNLLKTLSDHLQANSNNAIRVGREKQRLKKASGNKHKFAFTFSDITERFGSVDNLLNELVKMGFTTNVKFTLLKLYEKDNKFSYCTQNEVIEDLTPKAMTDTPNTPVQNIQPIQHQPSQPFNQMSNYGLGHVLGAPEVINSMVEARLGKDYKKRAEDAEEKLKDSNSQNRILREKISALEIKLATIKDKSELERERDKLDRKGFLETDAGASVMETLGKIIPQVIEVATKKGVQAPAPTLAAPAIEVSEIKQIAIEKIQSQNFSDDQTGLVVYLLDNWEQDLIGGVMNLINQREENGG